MILTTGLSGCPLSKHIGSRKNIKHVISQGVEIDVALKGCLGNIDFRLIGNYAYTSSVNKGDKLIWGDESYNMQLPYIPLHSGNFLAGLNWKKFSVIYQFNSYGKRYTTPGDNLDSRNYIYAYYMNDVTFGKEFIFKKLNLEVQLKIYNLFNESYHTVLYRPMPGRNYMLN